MDTVTDPTIQAALFVTAHPWASDNEALHLALDPTVGLELPFCITCADWHQDDELHSHVEAREALEVALEALKIISDPTE